MGVIFILAAVSFLGFLSPALANPPDQGATLIPTPAATPVDKVPNLVGLP